MLKSLVLENFKAFGCRTVIPLAPITLIYGQNSAGKSSILQALQLFKQSLDNRDSQALLLPRSDTGYVDLGSFKELIFDHDLSRALNIRFAFESDSIAVHRRQRVQPDLVTNNHIEFSFSRNSQTGEIELKHVDLCAKSLHNYIARFAPPARRNRSDQRGDESAWRQRLNSATAVFTFWGWGDDGRVFWEDYFSAMLKNKERVFNQLNESLKEIRRESKLVTERQRTQDISGIKKIIEWVEHGNISELASSAMQQSMSAELYLEGFLPKENDINTKDGYSNFLSPRMIRQRDFYPFLQPGVALGDAVINAANEIQGGLNSLFPLGPFRRPPSRWYVFTGTTPRHVGYQGNLMPDLLFRKNDLMDRTNAWLKRLDLGYQIEVSELGSNASDVFEVRLLDTRRSRPVRVGLPDVGFGISQILPLVVQSLIASNQIISIEQPEVHIHPKLQADLGDLFADSIASQNNQFLIETHSEHLALRILRLVRNGKLRPEDVAILYVQRGDEGSEVIPISIDEDGYFIDEFPGGFFPERLDELMG